jgi:hypothetical protein
MQTNSILERRVISLGGDLHDEDASGAVPLTLHASNASPSGSADEGFRNSQPLLGAIVFAGRSSHNPVLEDVEPRRTGILIRADHEIVVFNVSGQVLLVVVAQLDHAAVPCAQFGVDVRRAGVRQEQCILVTRGLEPLLGVAGIADEVDALEVDANVEFHSRLLVERKVRNRYGIIV